MELKKRFYENRWRKIKAVPEEDVDRTSSEGKASSVQFIHFKFNDVTNKKISIYVHIILRLE